MHDDTAKDSRKMVPWGVSFVAKVSTKVRAIGSLPDRSMSLLICSSPFFLSSYGMGDLTSTPILDER